MLEAKGVSGIKREILDYVTGRGRFVSFLDLMTTIKGFTWTPPEPLVDFWMLTNPAAPKVEPNIVLWANVTEEAAAAMLELLKEGVLVAEANFAPMIYLAQGFAMNLPLAKDEKRCYEKPHWLPLIFTTPENVEKFKPALEATSREMKRAGKIISTSEMN